MENTILPFRALQTEPSAKRCRMKIQIEFLFTSFSVMNYIHNSHIYSLPGIIFFASQFDRLVLGGSTTRSYPYNDQIGCDGSARIKNEHFHFRVSGSTSPLTFSSFRIKIRKMLLICFCAHFILNSSDGVNFFFFFRAREILAIIYLANLFNFNL